jgi:hypothetical protein
MGSARRGSRGREIRPAIADSLAELDLDRRRKDESYHSELRNFRIAVLELEQI